MHLFQLAALELERTRRAREKQAAIRRLSDLDARLEAIDVLIRKRHEALSITSTDRAAAGPAPSCPGDARAGEPTAKTRRVLRYGR